MLLLIASRGFVKLVVGLVLVKVHKNMGDMRVSLIPKILCVCELVGFQEVSLPFLKRDILSHFNSH